MRCPRTQTLVHHEAHPYQKGRESEPVMSEMKFTGKSPPFRLAEGFASGAKFVLANRLSSPIGREIAIGFPMAG